MWTSNRCFNSYHGTDRPWTGTQTASTRHRPGRAAGLARSVLFGAMLAMAAMPGYAQKWTTLIEDGEASYKADAQSLRVNGNLRQIWIQLDLGKKNVGRMLCEFDCKEPRARRVLAMEIYSREGVLLHKELNGTTDWSPINREQQGEVLIFERICALRR